MSSEGNNTLTGTKVLCRRARPGAMGLALGTALLVAFAGCEDDDEPAAMSQKDAAVDASGATTPDSGTTADTAATAPDGGEAGMPAGDGPNGTGDVASGTPDAAGGTPDAAPVDTAALPPDAADPLYMMAGTIFGDSDVTYVVPVRSLAAGTTVDYTKGLSITGGAGVYGPDRAGHFFVGRSDSPKLTRYDVTPAGGITEGKSLSFLGQGLSNALVNNSGAIFISPTKAYFIHQEDLKAIIWNPTTMEIAGTIALPPELDKDGFTTIFDGKAQRQGNDIHLVATWADYKAGKYPAGALVVTIDTTTDTVVAKQADARCSQVFDSMKHPNGDIYYGCSTWSAAVNRVLGADFAAESCLLVIRKGQRSFDPAFHVKVSTLTGGQVAGSLIPGRGAEGFIRVLDETLFTITATSTVKDLTRAEAWRWWRLNLDTKTAAPITELAPSAAAATEIGIDGIVFTSLTKKDFSETTLIDMTTSGGPRAGLVLRGYAQNGIRVH